MNVISALDNYAEKIGFTEHGYLSVADLTFHEEIRAICEKNTCRCYATTWACPPAVGTVAECRERTEKFKKMMIFSKAYVLEDSFDFDGMTDGLRDFKKLVDAFQKLIDGITSDYLLLSNEGCGRCEKCTYPNAPCRFPHLLHHSLEGYGFIVSELAKKAGIKYNNGSCTVTYFGALLFS